MNYLRKFLINIQSNITSYGKIIYYTVEPDITESILDEVKTIINTLKNNKTSGEDNVKLELMKLVDKLSPTEIHKLVYNVWTREII